MDGGSGAKEKQVKTALLKLTTTRNSAASAIKASQHEKIINVKTNSRRSDSLLHNACHTIHW